MARPQQYDQDAVLKAAMLQFWWHGYAATSMAQLFAVTGLKAGSFYNAFDGKKALFLRVIAHYNQRVVEARIRRHLRAEDPLEAIEAFFLSSFEQLQNDEIMGCLLTNTSTEFGLEDAEINAAVWAGLEKIQQAFEQRLRDARRAGQLPAHLPLRATALHLLSNFQGMTVIGRLTQDKARLRSLTRSTMKMLRGADR